jgi:hypothetical protein
MLPDFVEDCGGGVYCVDTGFHRPRFDAAWLMVHEGRAAFIDTGTNLALPRHLATLDALGLPRDAVDFVILWMSCEPITKLESNDSSRLPRTRAADPSPTLTTLE